ncbi:MAG TPA: glycosyltransferase [Stackebrandtia sp.]|uniref:glycosyltransferase n=1 Tax=Stackebrandtia sp. TaxID=2023065 RepID=UPI002D5D47B2|nr:glycosyltransferase [Stackebrandtia sp.]HZE37894.1 glycosyltransferase [Stackebrandtia sp.]
MRIAFLSNGVFGIGGGIRATVTLANALAAAGHEVELYSLERTWNRPKFDIDPGIGIFSLYDRRADDEVARSGEPRAELSAADAALAQRESTLHVDDPPQDLALANQLTIARVAELCEARGPDVLISTKPWMHAVAVAAAGERTVTVAHAHTPLSSYHPDDRAMALREIAAMDAVVPVSRADAADYEAALAGATPVTAIPNAVPATGLPPSKQDSSILMAAGRLVELKQYHLLIDAFARVADRHPDWRLRLYGDGPEKRRLRSAIMDAGLHDRVWLMGRHSRLDAEWPKASIAAVTSSFEAFGLTIVEAMRAGVPVVSFDCDSGPREIIDSRANGVLVPPDDVDAMAAELSRLMDSGDARRKLAVQAMADAAAFGPESIAAQHLDVYARLVDSKPGRRERRFQRFSRRAQPPLPSGVTEHRPAEAAARVDVTATATRLNLRVAAERDPGPVRLVHQETGKTVEAPTHPADGGFRAALRLEPKHPQGAWEVRVGAGRVRAGDLDARALLDPDPAADTHAIPYVDADDLLAVRHWATGKLAELEALRLTDTTVELTVGGGHAAMVLRLRKDRAKRLDVAAADGRFTIPREWLTSHRAASPDLWDAWVVDGERELRVAKVRDDVPFKKKTLVYPHATVAESRRGPVIVRPYFTDSNMFSLRIEDLPF